MNAVNAHFEGHLIEEGIRRLLNRLGDIQHPVTGFQPVAVAALGAGQCPGRRAEKGGGGRNHASGKCRQRHIGFYRRCRRIEPLGHAVNQRAVRVIEQRTVRLIANPLHEGIWVIAGTGDHRQHAAVAWINHHHRRTLPLQYPFNILL